jgi:tetratricopeptide (TPR) repeat protein
LASFDRNKKEQEAQKALGRNNYEKAIEAYAALLRHDPRDRRIRQKLADLYQRVSRNDDAAKHYRELARLFGVDGNHRAAIAVYKKLIALEPSDSALLGELAGCYLLAGFSNDAIVNYEQAINGLEARDIKLAVQYCMELQKLKPGDTPLRIRTAELLALSGEQNKAFEVYRSIIGDLRRRGRMDEVGRLATQALKLKEDVPDLLQDAAEACLVVEDAAGALRHLQTAYQAEPRDARTLELLARAFEMGEDKAKARPILVALAQVLSESQTYAARVPVLERAVAVGDADAGLEKELEKARIEARLASLRLTDMAIAKPDDEVQLRLCTRMAVFQRYGFGQRGLEELSAMDEGTQQTVAVRAQEAELRIAQGQREEGVQIAKSLLMDVGDEIEKVQQRIAVLTGQDLSPYFSQLGAADEAPDESEPEEDLADMAGLLDDALESDEELMGEASPPPSDDQALFGDEDDDWVDEEPADDGFDELLKSGGTVAEVDPHAQEADATDLDEAEGLIAMGLHEEAMAALENAEGLRVVTLKSHCLREQGLAKQAFALLREAVDDADESDPAQADALFELAELAGRTGKHRPALRYLRELQESFPEHRSAEVSARVKALKKVLAN